MDFKILLETISLNNQYFDDKKIFKYHFILRFILPVFLLIGSIYLFYFLNIKTFAELLVLKSLSFYFLLLLAIASFISFFYLLNYFNKTFLFMNENVIIIKYPSKLHEIEYSRIEKINITPYGSDIKKIEIIYNNKPISLYGFENLKGILSFLEIKVSKNKVFMSMS
jgi:hypothetical protein